MVKNFVENNSKEAVTLSYGEGDNRFEVRVSPIITLRARTNLINEVVNAVFANLSNDINDYAPEFIKYAKREAIISYFTDFPMPKTAEESWLVINCTPLYEDVAKVIGDDLDDILKSIDSAIDAKKMYLVNKSDLNRMFEKVTSVIEKTGDQLANVNLTEVVGLLKKLPSIGTEELVDTIIKVRDEQENNKKDA